MKIENNKLLTLAVKAGGIPIIHWNDGLESYSRGEGCILLNYNGVLNESLDLN